MQPVAQKPVAAYLVGNFDKDTNPHTFRLLRAVSSSAQILWQSLTNTVTNPRVQQKENLLTISATISFSRSLE
jgi:hypothetical protein